MPNINSNINFSEKKVEKVILSAILLIKNNDTKIKIVIKRLKENLKHNDIKMHR